MAKQLTQNTVNEFSTMIRSFAISADGYLFGFYCAIDDLYIDGINWKVKSSSKESKYATCLDYPYDATNWQKSAIDRTDYEIQT